MPINYNLIDAGTAYEIGAGSCVVGTVSIPDLYLGKPITRIAPYAFEGCGSLTNIPYITNNITGIGTASFFNCTGLKEINLPNNLKTIEYATFGNCSSLEEIVMPSNLSGIADSAFSFCYKLERVYLNENIKLISYQAFEHCSGLYAITIPSGIRQVGPAPFKFSNLKSIYFMGDIPQFLGNPGPGGTPPGDYTFMALTSGATVWRKSGTLGWPTSFSWTEGNPPTLRQIEVKTLNSGEGWIFNYDGSNYSIGNPSAGVFARPYMGATVLALPYQYDNGVNGLKKIVGINLGAFAYSSVIKNVIIPGSISYISDAAFAVSSLENIYIPSSLTSLQVEPSSGGIRIFLYCWSLKNINVSPDNPVYSSLDGVLFNKNKTELLHLTSKSSYVIPDGTLYFAVYALTSSAASTLDFPASVISIPASFPPTLSGININSNNLFYSSDNGVLFNKNKTQLIRFPARKNSGNDITDLNTYYVPSSTTGISSYAFDGNSNIFGIFGDVKGAADPSLFYIVLGTGIKIFDEYTFTNMRNCFEINFPSSALKIKNNSIFGMSNLYNIGISSGNAKIETSSNFFNLDLLSNLEGINVNPNNQNYSSINGVLYDKNQTMLLAHPPKKYQSPNNMNFIPNTVTGIGYKAFNSSFYLTGLELPNSLKSIADFAFFNATGITTISIPSGVNDISPSSFVRMKNLEYIKVDPLNENFYSYKNVALINKNQNSLVRVAPRFKGSIFSPPTLNKIEDFALDQGELSSIYFPGLPPNNWDATYKPINSLLPTTLGALINPKSFAFRYKIAFQAFWKTLNNLNYKILPWSNNIIKTKNIKNNRLIGK